MTTTDYVLLIILTVLLSLQVILWIVLISIMIKIANKVKIIVDKADHVVDSVETAAELFKETQGKLAIVRLVKNIINSSQRKDKK